MNRVPTFSRNFIICDDQIAPLFWRQQHYCGSAAPRPFLLRDEILSDDKLLFRDEQTASLRRRQQYSPRLRLRPPKRPDHYRERRWSPILLGDEIIRERQKKSPSNDATPF